MELLSFSTPLYPNSPSLYPSSLGSLKLRHSLAKLSYFSLRPYPSPSIKCSVAPNHMTSPNDSQTLGGLQFEFEEPKSFISSSAPQSPASAMRGAESDVMGLLLRERIVFLGNEIDDFVADAIISQLLLLDAQNPKKDIRFFINSSGGSLSATMAIYDVVNLLRADVSTIALGISASTSSIILSGGTKGKRFAMPNARIMIHQPLGGTSGKALAVEIQAKEIMANKKNVIRIFSENTGRTLEQVEKDIDRDHYMSPIEAVEYGIIDGVIDRERIIPVVPLRKVRGSVVITPEIGSDFRKFLIPEIPDDEIF